jgi:hypothetical protein
MRKEIKAIKVDVMKLCWHMRGSVTYTEAMNMCSDDREIISSIVKDNLETTKKTGLPYF